MKIKVKRYIEEVVEVDVPLPFYYKEEGEGTIGVFTKDGGRIKIVYDYAGDYLKIDKEICLQSYQFLFSSDKYQATKEDWEKALNDFNKKINRLEANEDIHN